MSLVIFNRMKNPQAFDVEWLLDSAQKLFLITTSSAVIDETRFEKVVRLEDYEASGSLEFESSRIIRSEALAGSVVRLISTSESDVLRSSELREYFGLEGQSVETSTAFRDKIAMKEFVRAAGLRVPVNSRMTSPIDLLAFIDKNGFPVVVKPFDGASSVDTEVIGNSAELERFLARRWRRDLEVESFAEGELYHIDGFVSRNNLLFVWPSKYRTHCLSFKEGGYSGSFMLEPEHPYRRRLQAYAADVIKAFPGSKTLSFHLEVFVDKDGEFTFLEIAARTGGGRINSILDQCFGINLNRIFVRSQAGLAVPIDDLRQMLPKQLMGWALIPPDPLFKSQNVDQLPKSDRLAYCRVGDASRVSRIPEHSTDYAVEIEMIGKDLKNGLSEMDRLVEDIRGALSR